jgi:hypothetical protein
MFAVLHSDINYLQSGLVHLTSKPNSKKGSSAKVKDGIINLSLGNYLIDRHISGAHFRVGLPYLVSSKILACMAWGTVL